MIKNIAVITSPYGHFTLEYALASIAASGFRHVELWAASPHYCYADYTDQERMARREEIAAQLAEHHLDMPVLYPEQMNKYPLNIASASPYIRPFSMNRIFEYIQDARYFHAGSMLIGTGWYHLDAPDEKKYLRSVESLQQAADFALKEQVTLLVEPASPHVGSFAWDLKSLRRLLRDVKRDNVKACLDLARILNEDQNVEDWYEQLDGAVGHIHFAQKGGKALGADAIAVAQALHKLEELDYQGTASLHITFRDCCLVPDQVVFESGLWLKDQGFLG